MGGSYGASGNTAPTTEWNVHCDPDAAKIVLHALRAPRCEADPTSRGRSRSGWTSPSGRGSCRTTSSRLARRAGSRPDDSIALAHGEDPMPRPARSRATRSSASSPTRCASTWSSTPRYDGFYGAFIHDPLALAAALDRSLVETEALDVDVETKGEITAGMTVTDRRRLTGKPPNLDVAVEADIARSSTGSSNGSGAWRRTRVRTVAP